MFMALYLPFVYNQIRQRRYAKTAIAIVIESFTIEEQ